MQEGEPEAQGERVSEWFTQALGMRCWLVRQLPGSRHAVQQRQLEQQQQQRQAQGKDQEDGEAEAGIQDAGTRHSIGGTFPALLCCAPIMPIDCLILQDAGMRACPNGVHVALTGFANEAQFLAISDASLADVNRRLQGKPSGKQQLLQVPPDAICPTQHALDSLGMQ